MHQGEAKESLSLLGLLTVIKLFNLRSFPHLERVRPIEVYNDGTNSIDGGQVDHEKLLH